ELDTTGLFIDVHTIERFQSFVSGIVYYDANQNGLKDIGEEGMYNQMILLLPDSTYTLTNINGNYGFLVDPGYYNISYLANIDWQITSDSTSFNIVSD